MYEDGDVTTRLIMSKSHLAPLKAVSIPRLELLGTLVGLRLTRQDISLLYTQDTYKWSDLLGGQYECGVLDRRSEWKV